MPQLVTKTVKVAELRKGDDIRHGKVTAVNRKDVWATVELEDAPAKRLRLDDEISVTRSEPTEAEIAERNRERALFSLRTLFDSLQGTGVEKFVESLNKYGNVDWSNLGTFLEQQALGKVGASLRHVMGLERWAHLSDDDRLVTAFAVVTDRERSSNPNPLSRSTAVLANVLEDLDRWARDEVMDKLRWGGAELVAARLAELKAERS